MLAKTNKNDIELPLLEKKSGQTPLNPEFTTTFRPSNYDLETANKPKYFQFGFLNRLIFLWATDIVKVRKNDKELY